MTVVPSSVGPAIRTQLDRSAMWIVILSWLLFLVAALFAWGLPFGAGVWADFHPQHRDVPVIRMQIGVAIAAAAISFFGTLHATNTLWDGRRLAAATIVLALWSAIIFGGAAAICLTPRGPNTYDRYAGEQLFQVPWQYYPRGADSPSEAGFSAAFCLTSLRGIYDGTCHDRSKLTVRLSKTGFNSWDEGIFQWRFRLGQITRTGARNGYQLSATPDAVYSRRTDANGQLSSMAICDRSDCRRQFLSEKLVIEYTLPRADWDQSGERPDPTLPEWLDVDNKLAALVESWRAR